MTVRLIGKEPDAKSCITELPFTLFENEVLLQDNCGYLAAMKQKKIGQNKYKVELTVEIIENYG